MDNEANTKPSPPAVRRPVCCSMQSLVDLAVAGALLLGLTAIFGGEGLLYWLLIMTAIRLYRRAWKTAAVLIAAIVLMFVLSVIADLTASRVAAQRAQCTNQLRQLGAALLSYHGAHGSFPPAYVADANGKPMHSWRVLILPYLDYEELYERYRFDEPWDGPNNRKLHGEIVKCFRCPSQNTVANPRATSYVAVVGPRTAWRGDRPVRLARFIDNPETTILLVETKDSGIHWMEPRDLEYPPMPSQINAPSGGGISSHHGTSALVLFADGSVEVVSNDAENVDALLTIDGGDPR
ncbi:MAG: DUF1559 domain-containing protein [Pirellulaceae bacterium]|nr:DUF1559 domain-containing protein [Pirellulaceae bacterium]